MECPFCEGGIGKKTQVIHEIKGVAFESEGYICNKCGEKFETWEQGKKVEEKLHEILKKREAAVQSSYQKLASHIPS